MTRSLSKVFICCLISSAPILAQQKDVAFSKSNFPNPQALKLAGIKMSEGTEYIANGEYAAAVKDFLVADSINPNNADLNAKIGVCYLNGVNKALCLTYFRKAYQIKKSVSSRIDYFLARGYHLNYQWDSAIAEYQIALKTTPRDKDEINKEIEECNNGKALMQQPVKAPMVNMGKLINGPFSDFRPLISSDGNEIIFTSRRHSSLSTDLSTVTGEYLDDIWISYKKNGMWDTVRNLDPPVNTIDNDDCAFLGPDNKTLYLIREGRSGDIYKCFYTDDHGWSLPVSIGDSINSMYSESSMCLSPDGRTMYFSSDRPGGIGKKDIYISTKQGDSSWNSPVNMGSTINTVYDEDGVFMNPDGKTLYFSSKGHNTMGGYDIFMTTNKDGVWSDAQNLGYPINTPDDDIYFSTSDNGLYGYYGRTTDSNRLDIYKVTMTAFMPKEWVYNGAITDSVSHKKLKVGFEFFDKATGTSSPFGADTITGKYSVTMMAGHQYTIRAKAFMYNDFSIDINVPDTALYSQTVQDIVMVKQHPKPLMADSCIPSMAKMMKMFKGGVKDTEVVRYAIAHLDGKLCLKDMRFTIQLGAFHSLKSFNFKKYVKKIDTETAPDGVIHVTSGSFENYEEAHKALDKLKKKGLKDAWIMGTYNGRRYVLKELLHPPTGN
ncbi:MAG TPA: hypothetical protein VK783_15580 [Bacteroidia bacterium]|jgi:hypothetical protein|nr:hypothetical protein [Bacteroidia bacterium]